MALHIVFVEPEIPSNTGNIARTCAITDSVLHLVRPLGFNIDEKSVRRAGLDYWPYVDLRIHDSFQDFLDEYDGRRMFLATTKGPRFYTDVEYRDEDTRLRSLNLANSANIIVYEALRQLGFPGLA